MMYVDFLTVIVGALLYTGIQTFWFSDYFLGKVWEKLNPEEIKLNKFVKFVLNFIVAVILSYIMSLVEIFLEATSFWDGVVIAFILWIGFVFTTQFMEVFQRKNWKSFLIKSGFFLFGFLFLGIILIG